MWAGISSGKVAAWLPCFLQRLSVVLEPPGGSVSDLINLFLLKLMRVAPIV